MCGADPQTTVRRDVINVGVGPGVETSGIYLRVSTA